MPPAKDPALGDRHLGRVHENPWEYALAESTDDNAGFGVFFPALYG